MTFRQHWRIEVDGAAKAALPQKGKMSDKKSTSKERYDARTAVRMSLKLNKGTDADVLQRLEEVSSKQGYIKTLIRADIAKSKSEH